MPEQLLAIPAVVIIGLHGTFLFAYMVKKTSVSWQLPLPILAVLIYLPYEAYFARPEVSLSIPIRIDLLFIAPLTTFSLPLNAYCWFYQTRRRFAGIKNSFGAKSFGLLIVSVMMLLLAFASSVVWVSMVLHYIILIAIQVVKDVQRI